MQPLISVITPSFNQLDWLRLAIASVADQEQVKCEHIVQDGGTKGIEESLRSQFNELTEKQRLTIFVEKDAGMYDAINRGLAKSKGDICAYLNCDEQYLPAALMRVEKFFLANPDVDVLFGDVILVDRQGRPLSYRRSILPTREHLRAAHLNTSTCATFFRRRIFAQGFHFDPQWKAAGDAEWMDRLLAHRLTMAVLPKPLAIFTFTGQNLGASAVSRSEEEGWKKALPEGPKRSRAPAILAHRLRKLLAGAYWPRRVNIEIFTLSSPKCRQPFAGTRVGFGWPSNPTNSAR
ncbi:MAG: glycosyltransferase [Chthoniobacterales bacterium]|nr:glycosyltransferase [Chthoniobacterales bacterium]